MEVFDGSCKLIPVKIVATECMKVFDNFIPELVDALSSQMNPQMVCSTAGLCNSARIDRLLAEEATKEVYAKYGQECGDCHALVEDVKPKLAAASDKDIVERLLHVCNNMGSLSLGCKEIVLANFEDISTHIRKHFNSREVCDLSGSCKVNICLLTIMAINVSILRLNITSTPDPCWPTLTERRRPAICAFTWCSTSRTF
jgi:saposin